MTLEPDPGHAGGGTGRRHQDPVSVASARCMPRGMTEGEVHDGPVEVHHPPEFGDHRSDRRLPQDLQQPGGPARTSGCRSAKSRWIPARKEEPYRAYDCSGVYTDPSVTIDLEAGLPPIRARMARQARLRPDHAARGEAGGQRQYRRRQAGAGLPGGSADLWRQARARW